MGLDVLQRGKLLTSTGIRTADRATALEERTMYEFSVVEEDKESTSVTVDSDTCSHKKGAMNLSSSQSYSCTSHVACKNKARER